MNRVPPLHILPLWYFTKVTHFFIGEMEVLLYNWCCVTVVRHSGFSIAGKFRWDGSNVRNVSYSVSMNLYFNDKVMEIMVLVRSIFFS